MSAPSYRFGSCVDGTWQRHAHAPAFAEQSGRVVAGATGADALVFERLLACLQPPLHLLFVLHTPRGVGEPGRYQSPSLDWADVSALLARFGPYLAGDGRHELWAYSPGQRAQVVWDRHDRLFAYGPVDDFVAALSALGYSSGDEPTIPAPHEHHYHAGFDADAAALLAWCDWQRTPLQPGDEQ